MAPRVHDTMLSDRELQKLPSDYAHHCPPALQEPLKRVLEFSHKGLIQLLLNDCLWCDEEEQGFLPFQKVPNIAPSLIFSSPCAMGLDTDLQPLGDQHPTELTESTGFWMGT